MRVHNADAISQPSMDTHEYPRISFKYVYVASPFLPLWHCGTIRPSLHSKIHMHSADCMHTVDNVQCISSPFWGHVHDPHCLALFFRAATKRYVDRNCTYCTYGCVCVSVRVVALLFLSFIQCVAFSMVQLCTRRAWCT